MKKMKKCVCPLEHACKVDMRIVDSVLACHCQVDNEGVYSSRRRVYKKNGYRPNHLRTIIFVTHASKSISRRRLQLSFCAAIKAKLIVRKQQHRLL